MSTPFDDDDVLAVAARCGEFAGKLVAMAERIRVAQNVLEVARKVAEHWRHQDGINGAVLDELVDAVREYDRLRGIG